MHGHHGGCCRLRCCRSTAALPQPSTARSWCPTLPLAVLQEVIVANTIPVPPEHQFPELTVLSGELINVPSAIADCSTASGTAAVQGVQAGGPALDMLSSMGPLALRIWHLLLPARSHHSLTPAPSLPCPPTLSFSRSGQPAGRGDLARVQRHERRSHPGMRGQAAAAAARRRPRRRPAGGS